LPLTNIWKLILLFSVTFFPQCGRGDAKVSNGTNWVTVQQCS